MKPFMNEKLSHLELLARQSEKRETLPLVGVLNNIRSLYNVGSVFRTADGAGFEKLYLCGITGIPPSPKISKTALGAEKSVPWEFAESAKACLEKLRAQGYQIVLLEQTKNSIPYDEFIPQGPLCLVAGNEIGGVSDELLEYCDKAVEIEMSGLKISLNVTVAFGIAAYHFRNCLKKKPVPQGEVC